MKYIRGYIIAAALAALTWGLTEFAKAHTALVDMVYPYASRLIQDTLADWSAGISVCLWQAAAILLVVLLLASIIGMIIFKWNFFQWMGWVLSGVCLLWCLHTGIYGLNQYSSDLSQDIRLNTTVPGDSLTPLINAATYFRDKANELSGQMERDENGNLKSAGFAHVAEQAGDGFHRLVYEKHLAVFGGVTTPVKELGWADMYTSMGISGVTMPITGEAAVNPNIPTVSLPFTICHEMGHRLGACAEEDANFLAFLACVEHEDVQFRYSAAFNAFIYCYNALYKASPSMASAVWKGMTPLAQRDVALANAHYEPYEGKVQEVADKVNDTYLKAAGQEAGVQSYGLVSDALIAWYRENIAKTKNNA